MTAEIAVLNSQAVAMAADSAVTFGFGKIRNSADKIFQLSKWQPVGVMIYNNAAIWRLPWETVVKRFRAHLGRRAYPELALYADAFADFVRTDKPLRRAMIDERLLVQTLPLILQGVRDGFEKHAKDIIDGGTKISTVDDLQRAFEQFLEQEIAAQDAAPPGRVDAPNFEEAILDTAVAAAFPKFPFTTRARELLSRSIRLFIRNNPYGEMSGLVFAGYGTDEMLPSIVEYSVAGYADCHFHMAVKNAASICEAESCIMPFAQSDVVATFMDGVAPKYLGVAAGALAEILSDYPDLLLEKLEKEGHISASARKSIDLDLGAIGKSLAQKLVAQVRQFQRDQFSGPVLQMIAGSSKSELASIAESLVYLTSLRRQFSTDEESVGGPIDVAVISRGDGFVWIKRKHYFRAELNPQFIRAYSEDADHD